MLELSVTGKKSTKVMKICALVLALVFTVSGQGIHLFPVLEDRDTRARLQLGNNVFTTVQYGDLKVKVYGLITPNIRKKKPCYYFVPMNLFLPQSTKCNFNILTKENELVFSIVFWKEDLHQRIVDHIKDEKKYHDAEVDLIPFEKVKLTTTNPSKLYPSSISWIHYAVKNR